MMGKKLFVFIAFFIFVEVLLFQSETLKSYVDKVKWDGAIQTTNAYQTWIIEQKEQVLSPQELLQKIEIEAELQREDPINATIDRVWKAIPGYNGLEIDVEKTFKLATSASSEANTIGANHIPYVYREIVPEISLEDLDPSPIYKGNVNKSMVSLMINVAWGNEYIPLMLETLRQENVHATFFFDGSWLSKNMETARGIISEGHEASNHAYSHKNMSQLSKAAATMEIMKTEQLLKDGLGVDNKLFAPPSGDYDEETVQIAYQFKLRTILWTIDTVDWRKPDPQWIVRKISAALEPGSLILMHPTHSSSEALGAMIKEIKSRGMVLGTVSELISTDRIRSMGMPPGF